MAPLLLNGSLTFCTNLWFQKRQPEHFTYSKAPENVDDLFRRCSGSEPGQDEVKRTRLALHTSETQGAMARRQLPRRLVGGSPAYASAPKRWRVTCVLYAIVLPTKSEK